MRRLARSFINVRLDSRNGAGDVVRDLHVARNASYVLLLDSRGREVYRLRSESPRGEIPTAAVIGRMDELRKTRRTGRVGVRLLERLIQDPNSLIREDAVSSLRRMGPEAAPAVGTLIRALKDESVAVRRGAALALGAVGAKARGALPALRAIADSGPDGSEHINVVLAARRAVREINAHR